MERITLEIDNPRDVDLLKSFAKRIGVTIVDERRIGDTYLKHTRSIIEKGCDISSYGDPVNWQKKVRKDRKIASREA
ncbi:MAG: hypothetical protein KAT34_15595 [Candidatus Aminicenantes bacterium]|nr:hypothetical protein [Candidatus Aminicenantes bacterium]